MSASGGRESHVPAGAPPDPVLKSELLYLSRVLSALGALARCYLLTELTAW